MHGHTVSVAEMPPARRAEEGEIVATAGPRVTNIVLALVGGERLLREATASLLAAQPGLEVCGSFDSAVAFLSSGGAVKPAAVLLDCDGASATVRDSSIVALRAADGHAVLLLLCREIGQEIVRCAIEHRVGGIVLKRYSVAEVAAAIAYALTGRTVLPSGWQSALAGGRRAQLSPRHRQVLALIAQGQGNGQIAAELGVSLNTVKFHVRALYARLGVRNRVEAANEFALMSDDRG